MYLQVMTVVFVVLIAGSVGISPERKDGSEKNALLSLKLSTPKESICKGSTIDVEAGLVNHGSTSISIDPESLWYRASFGYNKPDGKGIGDGGNVTIVGDPGPDSKRSYVEIQPGKSYTQSREFALEDEKVLRDATTFEMSITYGQFREADIQTANLFIGTVTSNKIKFTQHPCRASRPGK